MALADIAQEIELTTQQQVRRVPVVDDTDTPLASRLAPHADGLPATAVEAAMVVEAYGNGDSVGGAARVAGLAPIDGAKILHLVGEPITPLSPAGRQVVSDWLDADISRTEALKLAGATEAEFALAVYIETHDPIPGAMEVVADALQLDGNPAVAKRDHLGDTMSDSQRFY